MATYEVTCYYNTGFDRNNIPSSPTILENATKKTFPSVWKLQDRGLTRVRLQANWEDVQNVDYCKIGNAYYTVAGIAQYNNVSELSLESDPITTAGGISAFRILDGWVKRCSHESNTFMRNTLPVDFTPTAPLVIDGPVFLAKADYKNALTYIGSTVDLGASDDIATTYADAATDQSVTVPSVPKVPEETQIELFYQNDDVPESWNVPLYQKLPNMGLYSLYTTDLEGNRIVNDKVDDGLRVVRGLNAENSITACYMLPNYYGGPRSPDASGLVRDMVGFFHLEKPTELPYRYGSYKPKNNRVYACNNSYTVMSIASGESRTFEAQELYSGGAEPDFFIYADPSPTGVPYCQPSYYEGRVTAIFEQAIKGATWLSTPITYEGSSGWINTLIQSNFRQQDIDRSAERGVADYFLNWISSALSVPMNYNGNNLPGSNDAFGPVSGLVNFYRKGEDYERQSFRNRFNLQSSVKMVAPSVAFARGAEIQGYVGNGFIVYRTRLSEQDMERLDNEFTMYGEPDNRKLKQSDLNSHVHFNYVEADNVSVTGNISIALRNAISEKFTAGIRLWHELPNTSAMTNNPLKGA